MQSGQPLRCYRVDSAQEDARPGHLRRWFAWSICLGKE